MTAAEDLARAGQTEEARKRFRAIRLENPEAFGAFRREVDLTPPGPDALALRRELESIAAAAADPRRKARCMALAARLPLDIVEKEHLLSEAIRRDPNCSLAHLTMAELLRGRGDDEKAFRHLKRAVKDDDPVPEAWRALADAYIERQDFQKAEKALVRYVEAVPDDAAAFYNIGTIHLQQTHDYKRAYLYLEKAHQLDPADLDILFNFAAAAIKRGDNEMALRLLRRAKSIAPRDPDVYYNLAVYYADAADDPDEALANFDVYLRLGGKDKLRVTRWVKELRQRMEKAR